LPIASRRPWVVRKRNGASATEAEWRERYATFYADGFNALQSYTVHRPEARDVLEQALAAGYRVVIATNALFPRAAVEARLRWAGIADLALARVTVLEDWHFAKPNPAYFAEILADLGLRPQDVLMVGNDPVEDIAAASTLGIPCWWVTDDALTPAPVGSILARSVRSWSAADRYALLRPGPAIACRPTMRRPGLSAPWPIY